MSANPPASSSSSSSNKKTCHFCLRKSLPWATLYQDAKSHLFAHDLCLLYSSNLAQQEDLSLGLSGFLPPDIRQELKRGQKLKCYICQERGATVGCAKVACKRSYHVPCALQERCTLQHYGNFKTFCFQHRPKAKGLVPEENNTVRRNPCPYCHEILSLGDSYTSQLLPWPLLVSSCCRLLLHRACAQEAALDAGMEAFKCPQCPTGSPRSRAYRSELMRMGVYVPDIQTATTTTTTTTTGALSAGGSGGSGGRSSGSVSGGDSSDSSNQVTRCDAKVCIFGTHPLYSNACAADAFGKLVTCYRCEEISIHSLCGGLHDFVNPDWFCYECRKCLNASNATTLDKPLGYKWGRAQELKEKGAVKPKEEWMRILSAVGRNGFCDPQSTETDLNNGQENGNHIEDEEEEEDEEDEPR